MACSDLRTQTLGESDVAEPSSGVWYELYNNSSCSLICTFVDVVCYLKLQLYRISQNNSKCRSTFGTLLLYKTRKLQIGVPLGIKISIRDSISRGKI